MARPSFGLLYPLLAILTTLLVFPDPSQSQQIGSFFTAIYLNGAPIASSQTSCSDMGQSGYCCGSGTSCGWDDSGKVACCASGSTCQGSPYGAGAASQGAGQYSTSQPQNSWQPSSIATTTVYGDAQTTECNCENTATGGGAVVPIVPVTKATLETSYYSVPTSTLYASPTSPPSTVTPPQGQTTFVVPAAVGNNQGLSTQGPVGCATVSTVTYANVGQPVKTQGCFIIINEGARDKSVGHATTLILTGCLGILGSLLV